MTNDNRKMIISHQAIEDAIDSSYYQQQMEQHREMILAQDQNIRRLKAELADMTAQRDTWQTMAIELEQQPERLKTVELAPEQWVMLEVLEMGWKHAQFVNTPIRITIFRALWDYGYISQSTWHITNAGRAALAAHKACNESEAE